MLTKASLAKLRQKAVRAGVWFKSLPRIDAKEGKLRDYNDFFTELKEAGEI